MFVIIRSWKYVVFIIEHNMMVHYWILNNVHNGKIAFNIMYHKENSETNKSIRKRVWFVVVQILIKDKNTMV